jgi:hypothetical protein
MNTKKYNYDGKVMDTLYYAITNDTLYIKYGNKQTMRRIQQTSEYTYKFTKTLVKAIDGAEGLKRFFTRCQEAESPFNRSFFDTLVKLVS